jgi:hypothetical protein
MKIDKRIYKIGLLLLKKVDSDNLWFNAPMGKGRKYMLRSERARKRINRLIEDILANP